MGILIPCLANALLRGVLSTTPGNFLAEKTWNSLLKPEASIGAELVLTLPVCRGGADCRFAGAFGPATLEACPGVSGVELACPDATDAMAELVPTSTKLNLSLSTGQIMFVERI